MSDATALFSKRNAEGLCVYCAEPLGSGLDITPVTTGEVGTGLFHAHIKCPVTSRAELTSKQGRKTDTGKPALDLIDPYFLEDVATVLTKGVQKYDLNQWQKGMAIGKAMAGVLRHCFAILKGEYIDPDLGTSHTANATCGLMFIHYFIRTGATNVPDDRWEKK